MREAQRTGILWGSTAHGPAVTARWNLRCPQPPQGAHLTPSLWEPGWGTALPSSPGFGTQAAGWEAPPILPHLPQDPERRLQSRPQT